MNFQGHDYRKDHFVTPRTISDFYPEPDASIGDWFVGAAAIVIGAVLIVVIAAAMVS